MDIRWSSVISNRTADSVVRGEASALEGLAGYTFGLFSRHNLEFVHKPPRPITDEMAVIRPLGCHTEREATPREILTHCKILIGSHFKLVTDDVHLTIKVLQGS